MADRPLRINHAELVYPKGGRDVARAAFELVGLTVSEVGPWLAGVLDPDTANYIDDIIVASEATPAQQAFEKAFTRALESDAELARGLDRYRAVRGAHPQYASHFGIAIATHEDWKARVGRIANAGREHPLLAGKIEIAARFEPGDPGAITHHSQAFVHTSALAFETLQLGLQIELQWSPVDDHGNPLHGLVGELPDLTALS